MYEGFRRNRWESFILVVIREVRPFCLLWVITVFSVAEPGMRGSTAGGHAGGTMSSTRPSSAVRVFARGVRFTALLSERWWGIVCVVPIPVPFLELLELNLMI